MAEVRQRLKNTQTSLDTTESEIKENSKSSNKDWANYALMIALAIGIKSWQPLAIAASKQPDGSYTYNKTFMVLLVEIVKLVFSAVMLFLHYKNTEPPKRSALVNLPFKQSLHFLVPSILYGASNTLLYYGMSYINPALFHVFGNIRILTAGLLYRFIMQRKQTELQWLSLILLTIGATLASPEVNSSETVPSDMLGLVLIVMMCICSTSSSIYIELNYKKTQELSIFYQNLVLYTYGVLVNGIYLVLTYDKADYEYGFFAGFDIYVVQVLVSQSAMGVSLSFIFKFLDNIVYVISLTVAMLATTIISVLYFDFNCTFEFICALVLVMISIYLYYRNRIFERFQIQEKNLIF